MALRYCVNLPSIMVIRMEKTMKKVFRKVLAWALTGNFLLSVAGLGVTASSGVNSVTVECESATYIATKSDNSEWKPKSASSSLKTYEGKDTKGIVFTGGDVGSQIQYTVDVETAGVYGFRFAFRYNETYFAKVQVQINGVDVGTPISMQSQDAVPDYVVGKNMDSRVISVEVGNAELQKGANTVTFQVVESTPKPTSYTVVLDSFTLSDSIEPDTGDDPDPEPDTLFFEAESTPFTVTDSTGMTTSVNKESKWAWSLNLGGASNVSGALTYFRSGGVGGTVDYKLNVKEAGEYAVVWSFRPNSYSYSTVQVLVNGKQIGGDVSLNAAHKVGGIWNTEDVVREIVMGNAQFTKGENIVTFKMIEGGLNNDAITIDYIRLGETVDESKLVFTEKDAQRPKPASKENSTPVTVTVPEGMLDTYAGVKETPQTTDKITVYELAKCYTASTVFKLKVDGVSVPVTSVGGDYEYASFDYDPTKGAITVEIEYPSKVSSAVASPQHIVDACSFQNRTVTATISENYIYNFCINGKNLVVAADPMQTDVPEREGEGIFNITKEPYSVTASMTDAQRTAAIQKALDDASAYGSVKGHKNGVVYVPAGVYYVGNMVLGSNTYLYLEPGAVLRIAKDKSILSVNGCKTSMKNPDGTTGLDYTWWITTAFEEKDGQVIGSYDIKIGGRGTVDSRGVDFWQSASLGSNTIIPIACSYFTCEGITIREAGCWSVVAVRSDHMEFSWLKIYQRLNMGEDDAIDICECQNVVVKNCAGYSLDDAFSAKTWPVKVGITMNWPGDPEYNDNVLFEDCLAYTRCFGFKIGQGTDQNHYSVVFRNNTVVYSGVGLGIHCLSGAGVVYDSVFENCYVEKVVLNDLVLHDGWFMIYTQPNGRGNANVKNVTVKNIYVYKGAEGKNITEIHGYDAESGVDGVLFSNIYYDGVRAETLDELKPPLHTNEFATNIRMENTDEPKVPVTDPEEPKTEEEPNLPQTEEGNGGADQPQAPTDTPADPDHSGEDGAKPSGKGLLWAAIAGGALLAGAAVWLILKKRK